MACGGRLILPLGFDRFPAVAFAATAAVICAILATGAPALAETPPAPAPGSTRVAVFNASLSRSGAGMALKHIVEGKPQVRNVAEIIQRVRPDVLLVLELDHDMEGRALRALLERLAEGVGDAEGIVYPHAFAGASNTGVPTGLDLDNDGERAGPGDAQGWGEFAGRYGMALLSRHPMAAPRTFRKVLWADMPGGLMPRDFYPQEAAEVLRLSSKSHWVVEVSLPDGRALNLLASHPTPPVFDGHEDRNGRRNHDEIRFWTDMIDGADWMTDDLGVRGGLPPNAAFVVLGDLNADPNDGDGRREVIRTLISHPKVQDPIPASPGGVEAARKQGGANARHAGDPAHDTTDWRDKPGPGNLRADFVLPSIHWEVTGAGIFWPTSDDELARLVKMGRRPASSDHRLVWVDIR